MKLSELKKQIKELQGFKVAFFYLDSSKVDKRELKKCSNEPMAMKSRTFFRKIKHIY
jgi:hypothetical protein